MKNILFFVYLLFSSISYAQFTAGPVPFGPGDENLIGVRYRALTLGSPSSQEEEYLGVPDLGVAVNRVATNLVYNSTFQMSFTYDAVANSITTVTTNGASVNTLSMPNISAKVAAAGKARLLSQVNFLQINVRNQTPNSTTTVSGIILNGTPVPASFTATGNNTTSAYAFYTGYSTTFTLTANIQLFGFYGGSTESNRVEFTFGSSLAILPLEFDNLMLQQLNGYNKIHFNTNGYNNIGTSYYLEASKNGLDFNVMDSTSFNNYTFEDRISNENKFYRVVAKTITFQKYFSDIVKVKDNASLLYEIKIRNGSVKIVAKKENISAIQLINVSGRIIESKKTNKLQVEMILPSIKGIYFIKFKIGEVLYSEKIIH